MVHVSLPTKSNPRPVYESLLGRVVAVFFRRLVFASSDTTGVSEERLPMAGKWSFCTGDVVKYNGRLYV